MSADGRTLLTLDRSGKLVLTIDGKRAWAPVVNKPANKLLFDGRGSLSLFCKDSHRLWSVGGAGQARAELQIQDDGNLVIYNGPIVVWASETRA